MAIVSYYLTPESVWLSGRTVSKVLEATERPNHRHQDKFQPPIGGTHTDNTQVGEETATFH